MNLCFLLFSLYCITKCLTQKIIKVGLLIPEDTGTSLHSDAGMYNSIGAIPVAIDRIVKEQLLNGYNFTVTIYNDDCDESLAIGYAAKLIEVDKVDVIFGPTCNTPAILVSSLGAFSNVPIMTWGLVTTHELTDNEKYPTTSLISGTSLMLAKSIVEVMKLYGWKQFAFLYSTTSIKDRCPYIKNDLEIYLNNINDIYISFQRAINNVSIENIKNILQNVKSKARIIVTCYEGDGDRRNHLLALNELEMNTDEYVNIFVSLRALGFGTRYTSGPDIELTNTGTVPLWIASSTRPDGRDAEAKAGARSSFVLDLVVNQDVDVTEFNNAVMERAQSWPFYCQNCTTQNYNASTFSRYLHDSFYLYALAVNRTLGGANETDAIRDGAEIIKNTKGIFHGITGKVDIDVNGTRDVTFVLYGLNPSFMSKVFVTVDFKDSNSEVYLNYTDESSSIWEMRGGKRPLDEPVCGFSGTECPVDFWTAYAPYVFGGGAAAMIAVIGLASYAIYYRKKQVKQLNKLWKVSYLDLDKPQKSKSGFQSERSLQSKNSSNTRMTFESMTETKRYGFFYFRQEPIAARKIDAKLPLNEADHLEFRKLVQIDNDNVNKFIGFCIDGPQYYALWKYCSRGSIKDVIQKGSYTMDAFFVLSIMRDIVNGLSYIHTQSYLGFHGCLTSRNCVVDDRWVVKISDFGYNRLRAFEKRRKVDYLWVAPELMRIADTSGTKSGDVYSFAIISSEILTCKSPWDVENRSAGIDELLYFIKKGGPSPIRPNLNDVDIPDLNPAVLHLIRDCWQEEPNKRPTIVQVRNLIRSMSGRNLNLMDHIFGLMEQYAETLACEVEERTKELVEEKKKSDTLLYRMLPKQVAESLKLGQPVQPEAFDSVTIFFSDVVQFTTLAAKCTPLQVVNLLNELYTLFDAHIENFDVYKVETIGDSYLCVSGLPKRNGNEHAIEIANLSLTLMNAIKSFKIPHLPQEQVKIRIGAHTGAVTAGVVGLTMPRYCLFGDTVNTASRMESNGKPGHIHLTKELNSFLMGLGGYITESRGEVIIKGKGVMETFWLLGKDDLIYTQPQIVLDRTLTVEQSETEYEFNHQNESSPTMYNQFIRTNNTNNSVDSNEFY